MIYKSIRVVLVLALLLPQLATPVSASGEKSSRLLAAEVVEAARSDLAAHGVEPNPNVRSRRDFEGNTIWIYGLDQSTGTTSDKDSRLIPFAFMILERDGRVWNVQTLWIERSEAGQALVIESTPAEYPDRMIRYRIPASNIPGQTRQIDLTLVERSSGLETDLGAFGPDGAGKLSLAGPLAPQNPGCAKDCITASLGDIGFWAAIALTCWVIGAGVIAVASAGTGSAAIVPIMTACLAELGVKAGFVTIGVVAVCIAGCF